MQFRSKPRFIEATQWKAMGDHPSVVVTHAGRPQVEGHQGFATVNVGDWIIAEADGKGFYPCDPATFATNYEPLHEDGTIIRDPKIVDGPDGPLPTFKHPSEPKFAGDDFSARVG